MNLAECRKRLERLPASDVVERPEWITAEHLQEIFKADREGRLRIAADHADDLSGNQARHQEDAPEGQRDIVAGWIVAQRCMVFQSRKACRSDYERRDEEC